MDGEERPMKGTAVAARRTPPKEPPHDAVEPPNDGPRRDPPPTGAERAPAKGRAPRGRSTGGTDGTPAARASTSTGPRPSSPPSRRSAGAILLAFVALTFGGRAHADDPPVLHEEVVLAPGPERVEPWFGRSVALAASAVVVGSPSDGDGGTANGLAHVFGDSKRGWRRVQRLQAADPAWEDRFAQAVAADKGRLVVGRDQADEGAADAGAVTVFRRSGYHFRREAELVPPAPGGGDGFGGAVAISGLTIAVGAPRDDAAALDGGSVTLWTLRDQEWSLEAKLLPPNGASGDWFGSAVAVDGATLVVGAHGRDDRGSQSGAAYVYRRGRDGAWALDASLLPDDLAPGDWFGFSVAVKGDRIAVGSPRDDTRGESAGAVRIYRRTAEGWQAERTLRPAEGSVTAWFGYALAMDGARLLVGMPGDDRSAESGGSASLYERIGQEWSLRLVVAPEASLVDEMFGSTVALGPELAVVGRLVTDDGPVESGRAWVFRLAGTPRKESAKDGSENDAAGASKDRDPDEEIIGPPTASPNRAVHPPAPPKAAPPGVPSQGQAAHVGLQVRRLSAPPYAPA